jgi:hypothetical protein
MAHTVADDEKHRLTAVPRRRRPARLIGLGDPAMRRTAAPIGAIAVADRCCHRLTDGGFEPALHSADGKMTGMIKLAVFAGAGGSRVR